MLYFIEHVIIFYSFLNIFKNTICWDTNDKYKEYDLLKDAETPCFNQFYVENCWKCITNLIN